jgi:hypothetical protein
MSAEFSERDIEAVKEVIANSELDSIEFYEVSASRNELAPEREQSGKLTIEVQQRFGDSDFGVRLNAKVVLPIGEASARVAGEYVLLNEITPTRRTLQLFANEVGVMTVLPYLREAIATITTKVFGSPVHLPLAERGEIVLDLDEE